jgi:formamidopyrimidine-DNA glycosylase
MQVLSLQVILETDCGVKLAYCDPRRFGRVRLVDNPEDNEPISKLGFDPLLSMPELQTFVDMLAKERRAIKPLIMDQVSSQMQRAHTALTKLVLLSTL